MTQVFQVKECSYNLRQETIFKSKKVRTVKYGIESASFVGSKIWKSVPKDIKESNTLVEFKQRIKRWTPENCPCKICKDYIFQIGYL